VNEDLRSYTPLAESSLPPAPARKSDVVLLACRRASVVVSFTEAMLRCFGAACATLPGTLGPELLEKVVVVPQAVTVSGADSGETARADGDVSGSRSCSSAAAEDIRAELGLPAAAPLFLLISGLRPVKAPTFLFEAFAAWRAEWGEEGKAAADAADADADDDSTVATATDPRLPSSTAASESEDGPGRAGSRLPPHLVIVGPPLDAAVAAEVLRGTGAASSSSSSSSSCGGTAGGDVDGPPPLRAGVDPAVGPFGGRDGLHYHPPVPRPLLLSWLRQCTALVNSSVSEGMSNALLEAMALGVPVVARRNEGNEAVVGESGDRGLLFDTPEEAVAHFKGLLVVEGGGEGMGEGGGGGGGKGDGGGRRTATTEALIARGKEHVRAHHSVEAERAAWLRCLEEVVVGRGKR
jgi:hypothetical protein